MKASIISLIAAITCGIFSAVAFRFALDVTTTGPNPPASLGALAFIVMCCFFAGAIVTALDGK